MAPGKNWSNEARAAEESQAWEEYLANIPSPEEEQERWRRERGVAAPIPTTNTFLDHGMKDAFVVHREAALGLLGLVDVLIDVTEAVSSLSATQAIAIRNEFAVKLGVDKRGE